MAELPGVRAAAGVNKTPFAGRTASKHHHTATQSMPEIIYPTLRTENLINL